MNKKLQNLLKERNFDVKGNFAYGKVDGFEVNVKYQLVYMNTQFPITVLISTFIPEGAKQNVKNQLEEAKIKGFRFELSPYGLHFGLNDITVGKMVARWDEVFRTILSILKENGALDSAYCPFCGEPLGESKECNISGFKITLDVNCVQNINDTIAQENQMVDDAPNNYLQGFLGACIGGLAGAAIAFILYFIGLISSISAAVAAILGSFLYIKFGGKKNKGMILIVMVTTLVFMMLSVVVVYIVAAAMGADEAGVSMSAIDAFKICMKDEEFSRLFIMDLLLTILFSVLGVSYQAYQLFKMTKRQKQI